MEEFRRVPIAYFTVEGRFDGLIVYLSLGAFLIVCELSAHNYTCIVSEAIILDMKKICCIKEGISSEITSLRVTKSH